eukprot:3519404-Lingulodinium_polyedra.AAC.1
MSDLVGQPPSISSQQQPPKTPFASLLLGKHDLKMAGINVPEDNIRRERLRADNMLKILMKMASPGP